MLDAAREAVGFLHGRSRDELDTDRLLARGLVSCLQEIGEAASRVTRERRDRESGIPWDEVIGMRHRVVHDYRNVRLDVVWETVTNDLPMLIDELGRVLPT